MEVRQFDEKESPHASEKKAILTSLSKDEIAELFKNKDSPTAQRATKIPVGTLRGFCPAKKDKSSHFEEVTKKKLI